MDTFKLRVLVVSVVALCLAPAQAQNRATLRAMLADAGFSDGATGASARDLDRALTSSAIGALGDSFVAAYYFVDESPNQSLGPLHVSRFDRQTHRWIHARPVDSEIGGSVLTVTVSARYVILGLHWNPSAGQGVVFDGRTLGFLGAFEGYSARELRDGVIIHSGNARHFAPTHQYRMFAFEPRVKRSTEIFPGPRESRIAAEYREKVRTAYAQLPQASREPFDRSPYGGIDDFDRNLGDVIDSPNGKKIAFSVAYASSRLDDLTPSILTVVRCERQSDRWSCVESSIEQASRVMRITVTRDGTGGYDAMGVERLLRALVER